LRAGTEIPLSRTAVPAEPDELLRSLQNYLGGLDTKTVTAFVENAAQILQGNGENLNRLIQGAAGVVSTLASKRNDLASLVVELNKLTLALGSRQQKVAQLITAYNQVAGTLTSNRSAVEGTVSGLNSASLQLASLLIEHRAALTTDIATLATTGRTLDKNVNRLALTTRWAADLFAGASRAVDFTHNWLRLNNQGQPLAMLILQRLEERLMELCAEAGVPSCTTSQYWASHVPSLFCFQPPCKAGKGSGANQLAAALNGIPQLKNQVQQQDQQNGGSGSTQDAVQQLFNKLPGFGGTS
ncbi:MAG TPA: MCE family protein, partial [Actinomycetota bacterium]